MHLLEWTGHIAKRPKEVSMIELRSGNVLLKSSDRRFLGNWLKKVRRLGQRLGDFVMKLSMQRVGRSYEVRATVHDAAGDFQLRSRKGTWEDAVHELMRMLTARLRGQRFAVA